MLFLLTDKRINFVHLTLQEVMIGLIYTNYVTFTEVFATSLAK